MEHSESTWDSKLYNEKHSFVYDYGESLITLLNPKYDEIILDLGCGSGQLTSKISEKAKEVVGIDKSPEMIEKARLNFPQLDFQIGDATDFHFANKFDSIFSNATLHWVTDYGSAINCMYSNLKPGGKIVVEFGGKGNVLHITDQLRKTLRDRGYPEQSNLQLWYFPTIAHYTTELELAGFNVVLAQLYERPTELMDEMTGIIDWISMFGSKFLKGVEKGHIEDIKSEVQDNLKSRLFRNGKWYADYKRLRVVAEKVKI